MDIKTCPACGAHIRVLIKDLKYGTYHCADCLEKTSKQAQEQIAERDREFLRSLGVRWEEKA